MNFVRGVADFLRKSSLVQEASQSSDSESRTENLPLPPSWPEVQFSQDGDEKVLEFLWKGYQEAPSQEETQKALAAFLVKFNQSFKDWRPDSSEGVIKSVVNDEIQDGSTIGNQLVKENAYVEGCAFGHPTRVIVGLLQELKVLAKTLREMHSTIDTDPFILPQGCECGSLLLNALEVATRSPHNRFIFSFFGGLQLLMSLMKAAVVHLKTVASTLASDLESVPSSAVLLSFLHGVLVNIVSITYNFMEAGGSSSQTDFALKENELLHFPEQIPFDASETIGLDSISSTRGSTLGGNKSMQRQSKGDFPEYAPSSSPLLETGGLNWFVELLRILRRLCFRGAISDLMLEHLTLQTLKKAIDLDVRTQNHFRSIGGLDVVLEGLGNPLKTGLARARTIFDKSRHLFENHGVFKMQILSFEVLRAAVFRNSSSLLYLQENGGVEKLSETIQWVAFLSCDCGLEESGARDFLSDATTVGALSHTMNMPSFLETEESKGMGLQYSERLSECEIFEGLNSQVACLCTTLCSFILLNGNTPYFEVLPFGNDSIGVIGSYWEMATKFVVDVLLSVFKRLDCLEKDSEAIRKLRIMTSRLQHYVLHVFKKLLAISPTTSQLFREGGVWRVMFSESFFYFMLDPSSCQSIHGESSKLEGQVERKECFNSGVVVDSESLQLEIISFVELAATANGCSDNLAECSSLLEALEQCQGHPGIVTMLVKSLHRILQLATETTISAFHSLDFISIFSRVVIVQTQKIDRVAGESMDVCLVNQKGVGESSLQLRGLSMQSMSALFTLFEDYLSVSEQAKVDAVHNLRLLDVLLVLLRDEASVDFSLRNLLNLMKLPIDSRTNRDDKLRLCSKYLETLSEIYSENYKVNIIVKLLSGIRDVLQNDCKYYQALFQEAECFVHIVSLLNKSNYEGAGADLSLEVVLTLRHLLAGNDSSKMAFRELVGPGYRTLEMMLGSNHPGHPNRDLFFSVLNMVIEGDFDMHLHMAVENEDAVILLFKLLAQCTGSLLFDGLDAFQKILEDSTANQALCTKSGLLSLLLNWFSEVQDPRLAEKLAELIRLLGSYSITGTEMRKMFSLLRSLRNGSKQEFGKLLLNTFKRMIANEGPPVFFELNGKNSGIVVTSPLRFPNKGFTFSCWARVEGFPSNQRGHGSAMMNLFNFVTEGGKGYNVSICETEIAFESIAHKMQIVTVGIKLSLKQWHCLCITHASGYSLSRTSDLNVFVDGKLVGCEKLRYPKLSEPLTRCTIAARSPDRISGGSEKHSVPFRGQLGPLYFFNEALSADQVFSLYSLGPGYMYAFISNEVGCNPETFAEKSVLDLKDGLGSKVVFGYNAQASTGRHLYDVSPALEHIAAKDSYDATILEGTRLCHRHLVQDSITCVGGVAVFFPLITLSEQPGWTNLCRAYEVAAAGVEQEQNNNWNTSLDMMDDNIAVSVIEVVRAILAGSVSNQQFMHDTSCLSILGFLLKSLPARQLTLTMVSALDALLNTIAVPRDVSLSKDLVMEGVSEIFLNMKIWIRTSFIVQRAILVSLLNYCQKNSFQVRSVCGLATILDILHQFYYDKPTIIKASNSKVLLYQMQRSNVRGSLTREEVAQLRSLALAIAKEVLMYGITLSELKALVFYLEESEDDICVEDVLRMLLQLLAFAPFSTTFDENIRSLGGCEIFLDLLTRRHDTVKLLGLRFFSVLLTSSPAEKKVPRFFNLSNTGSRLFLEQQQSEKVKLASLWDAFKEKVLMFTFTIDLLSTLFDILLGGAISVEVKGGISLEVTHDGELRGFMPEASNEIAVPQMLGVILKLLLNTTDLGIRSSVLKGVLQLLEWNPKNCDVLVSEHMWQDWFFDILVSGLQRKKESLDNAVAMLLNKEELYIKSILAVVHTHCISNLKGGWQHLDRTVNYVHIYADMGKLSRFDLLSHILSNVMERIVQTCPIQSALTAQPCRDNILYAVSLVDELSVKDTIELLLFHGDIVMEEAIDSNSLSGGYIDLGSAIILKPESTTSFGESEILPSGGNKERKLSSMMQPKTLEKSLEENPPAEGTCWHLYESLWNLLSAYFLGQSGAGTGVTPTGPTLGQRARGLVESLNVPASEIAAAVVSGGLGSVVGMNVPVRLVDKAIKLRAEKCPRVVFRLVLLYLYKADLQAASRCIQQFLCILPAILSPENEIVKNRIHLFLWSLLDARAQVGPLDDGARFHIISQLIREILDQGKGMLTSSLAEKSSSSMSSEKAASVHSLLQQDRVLNAVKDEAKHLRASLLSRTKEVESLNSELNELSLITVQQKNVIEDQGRSLLKSIHNFQVVLRAIYQRARDEEEQEIANRWCHMFRNLTDERGPWSPVSFPDNSPKWWKLDKAEDPCRRRFKLKRNYKFNYDLIQPNFPVVTKNLELKSRYTNSDNLEETAHLLNNAKSPSVKGTGMEFTDEGPETAQDESSSEIVDISRPANPHQIEISHNNLSKTTGDKEEDSILSGHVAGGEEEVILSVTCVLVSPRRKVSGRLEVMPTSLHFYGKFIAEGSQISAFSMSSDSSCTDCIDKSFSEESTLKTEKEITNPLIQSTEKFEKFTGASNAIDSSSEIDQMHKTVKFHKRWDISQITTIHETRYLLQHTAIEIHFSSSISPVFFNFKTHTDAKEVASKVASQRKGISSGKSTGKKTEDVIHVIDRRKASELAEKARESWRRRELDNFEYLTVLNTLAGRSYNDLTQFPIFPWILADYTSEELDLSKASTFRDLSLPIGALDEKRLKVFEERYQNFTDPDIPSFYYGSHYSSMGIVLFYLLRLEPFTSLHRSLQGGKFDHADRLFHSIAGAYANCLSNTSDVKELIPEFFYMPEFLTNDNNYYFGVKQDGERIGDVILPTWAKGSPEEFIRKNREALETEHVSDNLHQWIDLIFGYKQRGRPAVEAANIFYYLTYEGAVDLEAITDPAQRAAIEDQIANFGQTPVQLFRKKHPKRGPPNPAFHPLYYAPASITLTSCTPSTMLLHGSNISTQPSSVLFVGLVDGKVVTVSSGLIACVRIWITSSLQGGGSFTFSSSQDPLFGIGPDMLSPRQIAGAFVENIEQSSQCFDLLQVQSSCFLLTCCHWDHSFKVVSLDNGHMVQSNLQHKDVITCVSVGEGVVVTGSMDTTVMVWDVETSYVPFSKKGSREVQESSDRRVKPNLVVSSKPRHILCGHDDAVMCVAVRVELDIVVSGSKDASCIFHTLREGRYVRSLKHPKGSTISKLAVSQHARVVLYSADDLCLRLCSVNGKWLACADTNGRLNCMRISSCGEFLVHGGDQGQVFVRNMHSLDVVRRYDGIGVAITSLYVTPEDCFLVGTQDGSLLVYSIELYPHRKPGMLQSIKSRPLPAS